MTEVDQVLAAIAANDQAERESMERMYLIKRQEIARDLRKGRRVLPCHCVDCIEISLALGKPDPYRCSGARARAADERARAAKETNTL